MFISLGMRDGIQIKVGGRKREVEYIRYPTGRAECLSCGPKFLLLESLQWHYIEERKTSLSLSTRNPLTQRDR